MERSDLQVLIDAIVSGTPNTAATVRAVLNAIADGTAQTGDIKEIDVSNAYLTANFDASGLGINERLGWVICNGNNGTRDRGGRVPIQTNSVYPVLGATGGNATVTLSASNIPPLNVLIKKSSSTSGGTADNFVCNINNNAGQTNLIANSGSSNTPVSVLQPYIVTLFIMKL